MNSFPFTARLQAHFQIGTKKCRLSGGNVLCWDVGCWSIGREHVAVEDGDSTPNSETAAGSRSVDGGGELPVRRRRHCRTGTVYWRARKTMDGQYLAYIAWIARIPASLINVWYGEMSNTLQQQYTTPVLHLALHYNTEFFSQNRQDIDAQLSTRWGARRPVMSGKLFQWTTSCLDLLTYYLARDKWNLGIYAPNW